MKFRNLIPIFLLAGPLAAQQPATSPKPDESALSPSWETQKQARTFLLSIPAPRGQITDRNGNPLAQTRVSYNLAINFPTPLKFTDEQALEFAHEQIGIARGLLGRTADAPDEQILKHYHNRGVLPLDIAMDLVPSELVHVREHPQLTTPCTRSISAFIRMPRSPATSSATPEKTGISSTSRSRITTCSGPRRKAARAWNSPSTSSSQARWGR